MRVTKLCLALLMVPALAAAQSGGYGPPEQYPGEENARLVYADVLRVDPVYETVRVNEPREECYDTEVTRRGGRYENTNTGTIVGAIIGGALGNQVGKGDGRKAATVVGAVAGGVIGNKVEQDQRNAPRFEIFVRMDDGRRLVVEQPHLEGLREGDYVQIVGNRVQLF